MSIRVIQQSSSEREAATRELFLKCKPYLDEGYGLWYAVRAVTGKRITNSKNGWYRHLRKYVESQGYKSRTGKQGSK